MKRCVLLSFVFLLSLSYQCEEPADARWGRKLVNNSDIDIMFCCSFVKVNDDYIPTLGWPSDSKLKYLKSGEEGSFMLPARRVNYRGGDSIAVYVFHPDTVSKYTWNELERDQNYLKKYEFKCSEFGDSREGISYP